MNNRQFEDYFSELQADMVSICLEYVAKRAEQIYIYCSFEEMTISCDFFYCICNTVVRKHELNSAIHGEDFLYDTSTTRQTVVMDTLVKDVERIYQLCKDYQRDMPTEIKLIYDIQHNRLTADYRYDLVYSPTVDKTADDIALEWFEEIKVNNEV